MNIGWTEPGAPIQHTSIGPVRQHDADREWRGICRK